MYKNLNVAGLEPAPPGIYYSNKVFFFPTLKMLKKY